MRDRWGREGGREGREGETGGRGEGREREGGREGREGETGGRGEGEREREREAGWNDVAATSLPRGLSALSMSAGLFSGKKKSLDSYVDT